MTSSVRKEQTFEISENLKGFSLTLGVGYTWPSLRFLTFILFSLTYLIVITKSKKSFKNVISKKITGRFIEWHWARSNLAPQKPIKLTFLNKRPGNSFWNEVFERFLQFYDLYKMCESCEWKKNESMKFEHLPWKVDTGPSI